MKIKIKKLKENAVIPTHGSEYSAGYDLYACNEEPVMVAPHQTVKVGTGLAMEIPEGYCGLILARSGIATKRGLAPANKVGLIDSDYRGEFVVAIHNHTNEDKAREPGERIAQLVIVPYLSVDFEEADELSDTERGSGGFGHTGTK